MDNLNMNDFVDWDKALDPALDQDQDSQHIGLVLGNINEDDFSFSALQHFTQNNPADLVANSSAETWYETPENPCTHCALGGYSCKKIREGRYKGYCTSCVALRVECSLSGTNQDTFDPLHMVLPADPWPTTMLGEHPNMIPSLEYSRECGYEPDQASNNEGTRPSSFDMSNSISEEIMREEAMPGAAPTKSTTPPKIGARFSRESVRILKNWLSTHHRHPYPSEVEKEVLQRQTGLNKTQITNWLANARRRGKVQPPRSTSPHYGGGYSQSIDIPKRPGTPALEAMNPLQRWAHSPPENEPASASDIARAVTASSSALSSGLNSPYSYHYTDDGSNRSLCNQSSTSSVGTSQSSNGSFSSVYSQGSRKSWGSIPSIQVDSRGRRRRRRRATKKDASSSLAVPLKTFQCTFCTETFRTKHDWQRHEKSLHLSLERWVCAPDGPRVAHPDTGKISCVFCGIANPDDAHIDEHNHSVCQERSLEERTFYRKDHLNQHLRLVHNVKFADWSMQPWKVATPEIRSRCGFCGIVMDTWTFRVDHLAEHFKTGYSMADWKGDWGFDVPVLDMVENSIPPYLIHHERNSPLPYVATQSPPESPRNAWGLIKLELAYFISNHWEQHQRPPSDDDLTLEGCRIIFASELLSLQGIATQVSWLRDIIMNTDTIARQARFGPLRGAAESRLHTLKINGKDNLFEQCPMEFQLRQFVKAKSLLGLTTMDDELQEEACRIVGRIEETCTHPSDDVSNWLLRNIKSSTSWLAPFRRRVALPRSEDVMSETIRSNDTNTIDSTIHSYSRLECELADFLKAQRVAGREPSNEDLQRQARIIIYEFDDGWNQTAADNVEWLEAFRSRHPIDSQSPTPGISPHSTKTETNAATVTSQSLSIETPISSKDGPAKAIPFFVNDANCYIRLSRELKRYVSKSMSANNPNQHVPTDEELKYQARWILYDDDDPWNYTAADNAEWLERFKRDNGLATEEGPGLPEGRTWALEQGGSGFAPPYAYPKGQVHRYKDSVDVSMQQGAKSFKANHSAANRYLNTLTSPNSRPAAIFCSRELEKGLVDYVQEHVSAHGGGMPTDDQLQQKGREILHADTTSAEDTVVLEKFKEFMRDKLSFATGSESAAVAGAHAMGVQPSMDLTMSEADMNSMLNDMECEFGAEAIAEHTGGVKL